MLTEEVLLTNAPSEPEQGLDLLEVLLTIGEQKKLICTIVLSAIILSIVAAFMLPTLYSAEARVVMPAQSAGGALAKLGDLSALAGLASGDPSGKADLCVGILNSRSVADEIIQHFGLRQEYKAKTGEDARKKLASRTDIALEKSGIISIEVTDHDPRKAASMANMYVAELNRNMIRIQSGDASERRGFYEHQAEQAKQDLSEAEQALQGVQRKTGVVEISAQAQQTLRSESELRAQLALQEAKVQVMRGYMTPSNNDLKMAENSVAALRTQLQNIRHGSVDDTVSVGQLPDKGLEYIKALREVKFREAVYELTLRQMETARFDELRNMDAVQAIDTAVPAQERSSPKRSLIVVLGTTCGVLIALLIAFVRVSLDKARRDPERQLMFERIIATVRG